MKFSLLLTFLLAFSILRVASEVPPKLKFEKASPMPFGLFGMAYASDSLKIYLFGGGSTLQKYTSSILCYDTRIGQWLDLTTSNQQNEFRFGRAAYVDNYTSVFIVGGTTNATGTVTKVQDITYYDIPKLKMQSLGPNVLQSKSPGLAVWNDVLYYFGGSTEYDTERDRSIYTSSFVSYELSTGKVAVLPDLPVAKETDGGIVDGRLYVFGGFSNESSKSIHQYDLSSQKWTEMGNFDEPVSAYALAQYKHFFILVGDYSRMDKLLVYDTENATWKEFKMNLKIRHAAAAVVNGSLHVMGGVTGGIQSTASNSHWILPISNIIPKESK